RGARYRRSAEDCSGFGRARAGSAEALLRRLPLRRSSSPDAPGALPPRPSPASHCGLRRTPASGRARSEEYTSELQSLTNLVCRLLLEKKKKKENRLMLGEITHTVALIEHHVHIILT